MYSFKVHQLYMKRLSYQDIFRLFVNFMTISIKSHTLIRSIQFKSPKIAGEAMCHHFNMILQSIWAEQHDEHPTSGSVCDVVVDRLPPERNGKNI